MSDDSASGFYDELASQYHLIYDNWEASMARQAKAISSILQRESGIGSDLRVLDCACGIGTQSLGLAKLGYNVTGSDLSAGAVNRARWEAAMRDLGVSFFVADVRQLDELPVHGFQAVISMDNALAHLLSDNDLMKAARQMRAKLRPKGLLVASIRDYDHLVLDRPAVQGPAFYSDSGRRRIVFQIWDWADDRRYTLHLYITCDTLSGWSSFHGTSVHRVVLREELTAILARSGFENIRWLFPSESGFYQPVVVATAIV